MTEELGVAADPPPQQRTPLDTEFAEAVDTQIREAREVLRADAEAAGVEPALVDDAVSAAAGTYVDARVHSFIGILVERDVRSALDLRRDLTADGAGGAAPA